MTEVVDELVAELRSLACRCGERKRLGQTFCRRCYRSLPRELRWPLYNRIGEGYEEAHAAAIAALGPVRTRGAPSGGRAP